MEGADLHKGEGADLHNQSLEGTAGAGLLKFLAHQYSALAKMGMEGADLHKEHGLPLVVMECVRVSHLAVRMEGVNSQGQQQCLCRRSMFGSVWRDDMLT